MNTDLATWLLAQLDEDEKRQHGQRSMHEVYGRPCPVCEGSLDGFAFSIWPSSYELQPCGHELTPEEMEAFAPTESRADPFILADIAAKRRIVTLYLHAVNVDEAHYGQLRVARGSRLVLEDAVHLLALPYADRPGYDPAWAPEEES